MKELQGRNHGKESCRRNHGGTEKQESWERDYGGEILQRNHCPEAPGGNPGGTQEAPRASKEASGRHQGSFALAKHNVAPGGWMRTLDQSWSSRVCSRCSVWGRARKRRQDPKLPAKKMGKHDKEPARKAEMGKQIQEAPGGTQEAPRRHRAAPKRHPETLRRQPGDQRACGGKLYQNHRVLQM